MNESMVTSGKRLNFFVTADLYTRVMHEKENQKVKISELIRQALEHYLQSSETGRMEKLLEEGYKANYTLDRELNKEWESVDAF